MSQIKPDPNPKPNLEQPSDLRELEDGDWPAAIKPLHLKKIRAAAAKLEAAPAAGAEVKGADAGAEVGTEAGMERSVAAEAGVAAAAAVQADGVGIGGDVGGDDDDTAADGDGTILSVSQVEDAEGRTLEATGRSVASVQFMITRAMRAQLTSLGYTPEEVDRMDPPRAAAILAQSVPSSKQAQTRSRDHLYSLVGAMTTPVSSLDPVCSQLRD